MKLLRRILATIVITLAVIFVCLYWVAPIALSFYSARQALPVARVVPTDLPDHSISQAPGLQLSDIGYAFEVPWSDLDETKTMLYPKDKAEKTRVVLSFRSGLRLMVTAVPAREYVTMCATEFKMQAQGVEILFGPGASTSDYTFVSHVYGFTPEKMHYWSLSPSMHAREEMMLVTKSIMPMKAAESGIFNLQNPYYRGFQQGDPRVSRDRVVIDLYSGEGHFEMLLLEKDYRSTTGVTQPEINRIVQSVRKVAPGEVASSASAESKSVGLR
jgi:hypothetical protein